MLVHNFSFGGFSHPLTLKECSSDDVDKIETEIVNIFMQTIHNITQKLLYCG